MCIPPPPPDLNCPDIPFVNFTVLEPDPHNFDQDNDGIGCETTRVGSLWLTLVKVRSRPLTLGIVKT